MREIRDEISNLLLPSVKRTRMPSDAATPTGRRTCISKKPREQGGEEIDDSAIPKFSKQDMIGIDT